MNYQRMISTNVLDNGCIIALVNELKLLPYKMVKEFYENDWHFHITANGLEFHVGERVPDPDEGRTCGLTFWNARTILIPTGSPAGCKEEYMYIKFAAIHEFGHYFDRSKGFLSMSYEFQKIYAAEDRIFCRELCTASNTDSSVEYFAESFSVFVHNGEKLKEFCPLTYNYFTNIFNKYR